MRYVGAAAAANQEAAYSDQYTVYQGLKNAFQAMDYDYLYPSRVIFGDPDQCIERIKQVLAVGVTNVSLLVNFGGLDHGKVMASLDRFAKYVLPKFQ
jgi:alkanesulfonate monooxygenase SsuD/methylene tetrahydromethanopterin reductase-like flavin-dependent oxidoreductase (luciferase family)